MISLEDYHFVSKLDGATSSEQRTAVIRDNSNQCAKTLITLMTHISKDQTVQYVLTLIDDVLQEDNARVEVFRDYATRRKESVFTPFLSMLTRPDAFIVNQSARIITKLASWGSPLLDGNNLVYFLTWIRDQLKMTVSCFTINCLHIPSTELDSIVKCQMLLEFSCFSDCAEQRVHPERGALLANAAARERVSHRVCHVDRRPVSVGRRVGSEQKRLPIAVSAGLLLLVAVFQRGHSNARLQTAHQYYSFSGRHSG